MSIIEDLQKRVDTLERIVDKQIKLLKILSENDKTGDQLFVAIVDAIECIAKSDK